MKSGYSKKNSLSLRYREKRKKRGSTAQHIKVKKNGTRSIGCKNKQRFPDKIEAALAAILYNNGRAMMFSPMGSYYCYKHNCWHIGHSYERRSVKND